MYFVLGGVPGPPASDEAQTGFWVLVFGFWGFGVLGFGLLSFFEF